MNLKKRLLFAACCLCAAAWFPAQASEQNNPVANPAAVVTSGNARFTVLTPEMIRIEYSEKQQFEDRASFVVINRNLEVPKFTKTDEGEELVIKTEKLELRYKKGTPLYNDDRCNPNLSITMPVQPERNHPYA